MNIEHSCPYNNRVQDKLSRLCMEGKISEDDWAEMIKDLEVIKAINKQLREKIAQMNEVVGSATLTQRSDDILM